MLFPFTICAVVVFNGPRALFPLGCFEAYSSAQNYAKSEELVWLVGRRTYTPSYFSWLFPSCSRSQLVRRIRRSLMVKVNRRTGSSSRASVAENVCVGVFRCLEGLCYILVVLRRFFFLPRSQGIVGSSDGYLERMSCPVIDDRIPWLLLPFKDGELEVLLLYFGGSPSDHQWKMGN